LSEQSRLSDQSRLSKQSELIAICAHKNIITSAHKSVVKQYFHNKAYSMDALFWKANPRSNKQHQ